MFKGNLADISLRYSYNERGKDTHQGGHPLEIKKGINKVFRHHCRGRDAGETDR
jgi:hypothetical protein